MFETGSPIDRRAALRRLSLALGGVVAAPIASGLLGGCRTPSDLERYTYATLSEDQQRTLAALVDQILPATDTPGATEAGVPQFVDTMLSEWYAPEERDAFLADLARVDRRVQAEGGTAFVDLDPEAQAALVTALDNEAFGLAEAPELPEPDEDVVEAAQEGTFAEQQEEQNAVAGLQGELGESMADSSDVAGEVDTGEGTVSVGEDAPPPFYMQLKQLTLAGYYTSEVGATQELQWIAAPNRYDADVPLAEVGRAWA